MWEQGDGTPLSTPTEHIRLDGMCGLGQSFGMRGGPRGPPVVINMKDS